MMFKSTYVPQVGTTKRLRKSETLPNQSLTIGQILEKYVRGVPVDVVQRQSIWSEIDGYDLEKINRLDFAEKAAFEAELRTAAQSIYDDLMARKQRSEEAATKRKKEEDDKAAAQKSRSDDQAPPEPGKKLA